MHEPDAGPADRSERRRRLAELAALFTRLGFTAFGGPAAHIAMMEDEVVQRRRWLSREAFVDLIGAVNLIPGPNSTELAIHVGRERAGMAGLLVAGTCFILPAAVTTGVLAWAYVRYGALPEAEALLYGIKPVIIAVVVQALWRLGRTVLRTPHAWLVALGAAAAAAAGAGEILVLIAAGILNMALGRIGTRRGMLPVLVPLAITPAIGSPTAPGLWPIFWIFAKIGSVLFGSGYVLLAFLRAEFVEARGWLTETQLLDAVAVGQFTPGPVFTTATFVGYLLHGPSGAAAATAGIFMPAFIFVALSGLIVPRIRRSPDAGAFLDGVNAASLALMGVVTVQLGRAALVDGVTVVLALAAAALLVWQRANSLWLVIGGGGAGLIVQAARAMAGP